MGLKADLSQPGHSGWSARVVSKARSRAVGRGLNSSKHVVWVVS